MSNKKNRSKSLFGNNDRRISLKKNESAIVISDKGCIIPYRACDVPGYKSPEGDEDGMREPDSSMIISLFIFIAQHKSYMCRLIDEVFTFMDDPDWGKCQTCINYKECTNPHKDHNPIGLRLVDSNIEECECIAAKGLCPMYYKEV